MINGFLYKKGELEKLDISNLTTLQNLNTTKSVILVMVKDPTTEDVNILTEKFNIHPTAAEDITLSSTRSKYEEFDHNTLVVINGIKEVQENNIVFNTISIIDGFRYLIVVYHGYNETIEKIINNPRKIASLLNGGEDYLTHLIIDKEVDKYVEVKSKLSENLKKIENELMKDPNSKILNSLLIEERKALEFKERLDAINDLCLRLSRPTHNFIQKKLLPYFRDVYDHSLKAEDTLKTHLDRITSIRSSYMTLASNKMNETIGLLTIIMALMMPMTVITGFYGMNISLPFQDHPFSYLFLLGFMTFSIILFLFIFRKLGWLIKR